MKFDLFVIPFVAGLVFLLGYLAVRYSSWLLQLKANERILIRKGFLSKKLLAAVKEIVQESLLHRSIFATNKLLGFMHMSLAFGWFLLIVIGNLESRIYEPVAINPPYVPIFFKFFTDSSVVFPFHKVLSFTMDFLLLLVLTGVVLAFVKRFNARAYGMKKTTRLLMGDKVALMVLWFIFPLRLLAESLTSAAYGGGAFLTGTFGNLLGSFLPATEIYYYSWWAYSLSLGIFFVALPFSRYMHIPTEVVLIFSRHFGLVETNERTPLTEVELNSCSRCGICIDACQLSFAGGIHNIQSTYQLKRLRYNNIKPSEALECFMCGRCDNACPVGIDINSIRMISRNALHDRKPDISFQEQEIPHAHKADVLYFAGCMTHQTPSIKKAMVSLLTEAGVDYWFMDEWGGLCCGRPMMLAGFKEQARMMIEKNRKLIQDSGAKTLVTSCPICYKVFTKEYNLNIRVVHHTQYLLELAQSRKLLLKRMPVDAVYHDPCELSRDIRIYDEPRDLLNKIATLQTAGMEKENTLCCGNSLANITSSNEIRNVVARDAYNKIIKPGTQYLVTSCPMCKKAFGNVSDVSVKDISEMVILSLQKNQRVAEIGQQKIEKPAEIMID